MEWIWITIKVWLGWYVLAPIAFIVLVMLIGLAFQIPTMIRQSKCKHDRFRENRSCDAICSDCGKNIGFIGSWRDQVKETE